MISTLPSLPLDVISVVIGTATSHSGQRTWTTPTAAMPTSPRPPAVPYPSACSLPSREWCTSSQPIDPSSWVTGLTSGPHAQSGSVVLVSWPIWSVIGVTCSVLVNAWAFRG